MTTKATSPNDPTGQNPNDTGAAGASNAGAAESTAPKASKAESKLLDELHEKKSVSIEAGTEQAFSDLIHADDRFKFHTWHFDYGQAGGGVTVKATDTEKKKEADKDAE